MKHRADCEKTDADDIDVLDFLSERMRALLAEPDFGTVGTRDLAALIGEAADSDLDLLNELRQSVRSILPDEGLAELLESAERDTCIAAAVTACEASRRFLAEGRVSPAGSLMRRVPVVSGLPGTVREAVVGINYGLALQSASVGEALDYLGRAEQVDAEDRYGGFWPVAKMLIRGKHAMLTGEAELGFRLGASAYDAAGDNPDVVRMALELQAQSRRSMGDEAGEQELLKRWHAAFRGDGDGSPARKARSLGGGIDQPGLLHPSRGEDLLSCVSRLASLLEAAGDAAGASRLYEEMVDQGWADWVDPAVSSEPIQRRLERCQSEAGLADAGLLYVEELRGGQWGFRGASGDEVEELIHRLADIPRSARKAVVLGKSDIRENRFRYAKSHGTFVEQLLTTMQQLEITDPFELSSTMIHGPDLGPSDWILVHRRDGPDELPVAAFLVGVLPFDGTAQVSIHRILLVWGAMAPAADRLTQALQRTDSPAHDAMEGALRRAIQMAGRLISQDCESGPAEIKLSW